jgi:Putative MetA-pathway of phenol degradation
MTRHDAFVLGLVLAGVLSSGRAWAGPPFLTDDPEPVELKHWEFYAAAQWSAERHAASGTSPHIEVNYGALPNLQLHVIVPAVLAWSSGSAVEYGLGDIELGAKFRFVEEAESRPQVGVFPLITLPTGSKDRGLGAGKAEGLVPLWIQKSFGPWTTYGGGGLRFASDGRAALVGWLLQRKISEPIALGAEVYATVPLNGEAAQIQFNLGTVIDFSDAHHLLLSAGPSFGTSTEAQAYLAYQLTI